MKCKYRVRYFSSKGAYLVLLWTLLISIVSCSLSYSLKDSVPRSSMMLVPILVAFVCAPLSGWLADARFGNYRVFRAGATLLFIYTVIKCSLFITEALISNSNHVLIWIHYCVDSSLFVVGACACLVTALPLGLDQMPDASSSSIASYITWFVCTVFAGYIFGYHINEAIFNLINTSEQQKYHLIWALCLSVCVSVVLSASFALQPKWLIIEPKSPQSFKTIYQVIRFAAKHKAPLNRSAFTYWEEDIPSRIDLGKIKYGGPFTTEQVEDVKTVLRLLVIVLPFFFYVSFSVFFNSKVIDEIKLKLTPFTSSISHFFAANTEYGLLAAFATEFFIYPFIGNKAPSILKRFGAATFMITLVCFVCLALKSVHFIFHFSENVTEWIVVIIYRLVGGILKQVLLTSGLEFMCAQSPYNMRGLLLSLVVPLLVSSISLGSTVGLFLSDKICIQPWRPLILISIKTVLCLIGFLLFCVVTCWYKRRVRDDDYSTQRVVEEVYDRYLTAAAEHPTLYGTIND